MLSRCCNLTTLPLPFPLSFASLDTHIMGLLSPRGSQITTTTVAGTCYAMIMTRERCLLVLEFCFRFFFDQGIGSRSAAWASRVDVVWVFCLWFIHSQMMLLCMMYCCIRVALYASCMYPQILCNVRCNDIHLAKASAICASILGGNFEFL